ncbi:hypothetical protein HET69_14555 [Streptomyces sp. CJ_13]|uniref:hypothetical protein n=1 Tax=Streptomyces sp. CJ_13 TaxID=2724943 RepID=UPI001BDCE8DF|nr:hypothetical protein [Streptomyces sp. CJ_13]MBT1185200.1 hypothetical protein [Streptomyces sp. CJ_13]
MTTHDYQVVARCTSPSHLGATTWIYTHATSIQEATAKVQKLRIDRMTPGLYRITQVIEREPECTCADPGLGGKCAGKPWCPKAEAAAAASPVPD